MSDVCVEPILKYCIMLIALITCEAINYCVWVDGKLLCHFKHSE